MKKILNFFSYLITTLLLLIFALSFFIFGKDDANSIFFDLLILNRSTLYTNIFFLVVNLFIFGYIVIKIISLFKSNCKPISLTGFFLAISGLFFSSFLATLFPNEFFTIYTYFGFAHYLFFLAFIFELMNFLFIFKEKFANKKKTIILLSVLLFSVVSLLFLNSVYNYLFGLLGGGIGVDDPNPPYNNISYIISYCVFVIAVQCVILPFISFVSFFIVLKKRYKVKLSTLIISYVGTTILICIPFIFSLIAPWMFYVGICLLYLISPVFVISFYLSFSKESENK